MIARIRPRDCHRWAFDTRTGAACTLFVVNIAAAAAGVLLTSSPKSRPDFFSPQAAEENENPLGISGPWGMEIMPRRQGSLNREESKMQSVLESQLPRQHSDRRT